MSIYYIVFSNELTVACDELYEMEVFNSKQRDEYKLIPIKSQGVSERFQILSLAQILNGKIDA